jgi:hypothetical protein
MSRQGGETGRRGTEAGPATKEQQPTGHHSSSGTGLHRKCWGLTDLPPEALRVSPEQSLYCLKNSLPCSDGVQASSRQTHKADSRRTDRP